eukprot:TRINITY_DN2918_c0_g1_i1.p1 TRINITY_DN2918_c0_g1~~TRINITY_DN2918_c0_g1_i1.p1  ORF type:complete len:736 (-),score=66.30 TRINITY_DN2918_c0_g1_i1:207-2414(-)
MLDFSLWLHPLHGNPQRGLRPLHLDEMQEAGPIEERLALLAEAANAGVDQLGSESEFVEVRMNDLGLYVLNSVAERCLWLPLALSHIMQCTEFNPDTPHLPSVAGVLAYGYPIDSPALSWGSARTAADSAGEFARSSVWLLVVTPKRVKGSAPPTRTGEELRILVDQASEALGARGAIRGNLSGFEFIDQTLGAGSFATVQLMRRAQGRSQVHNLEQNRSMSSSSSSQANLADEHVSQFAAKVMVPTATEEDVLVETGYFLAVQGHPNVAQFIGLFCCLTEEAPVWTMIMEAHPRGNLKDKVLVGGKLSEPDALKASQDLLQALMHVHNFGIIHRDLKPENVLLANDDRAVLVDFGVSVHTSEAARMMNRCGSPGSIAPEILRKYRYGPKSDVFSCGTVLYYALGAVMPFIGSDLLSTLRSNARARVRFPADYFGDVSARCLDIVRLLLQVQPVRRPDANSAYAAIVAVNANAADIVLPGVATIEEDSDVPPDNAYTPSSLRAQASRAGFQEDIVEDEGLLSVEATSTQATEAGEDTSLHVPSSRQHSNEVASPHRKTDPSSRQHSNEVASPHRKTDPSSRQHSHEVASPHRKTDASAENGVSFDASTGYQSSFVRPSSASESADAHLSSLSLGRPSLESGLSAEYAHSESSSAPSSPRGRSNTLSRAFDYVRKRMFDRGAEDAVFSDIRSPAAGSSRAGMLQRPRRLSVPWRSSESRNPLQECEGECSDEIEQS